MNPRKINICLIFCIAIGGSVYGYNIGAMSGVLLFVKKDLALTPTITALFAASFLLGVSIVMVVTGIIANRIGRKKTLIYALGRMIGFPRQGLSSVTNSRGVFTQNNVTLQYN